MPTSKFHAPPPSPRPAAINGYETLYGLRENPFPAEPLFSPSETDPRRNGTIYDPEFHTAEEKRFFDLFVSPPTGSQPYRLGFVRVDAAAGARGNGKSMFLHRMMRRINQPDWPAAYGDSSRLPCALAVHLVPDPKAILGFHQLIYLLFQTLARTQQLDIIDGMLRAAVLYDLLNPSQRASLSTVPDNVLQERLRDDGEFRRILSDHSIQPSAFFAQAETAIRNHAGTTLDQDFLRRLREQDLSLRKLWLALDQLSWNTWRTWGTSWLTDGLVPLLLSAGYERLYVLLDEFERIYRFQTGRRRDEFLMALRQTFFEGASAAVRTQFISCILTLHPSVDQYLAENWRIAGLEGISPLSASHVGTRAVTLGASEPAKLRHLLQTFLDFYRTDDARSQHTGTVYPFMADALDPVFDAAKRYPRDTLRLAYEILAAAVAQNQPAPLTKAWVHDVLPRARAILSEVPLSGPEPPTTDLRRD